MNNDTQTLMVLKNLGMIDAKATNIDRADNSIDDSVATIDDHGRHQKNEDHPWFLQLFFGVSGIVASLFFIGFLSLSLSNTGAFDSMFALLIIGLALNATSFALFRNQKGRDSAFISSLAFAVSIAGQAYIAFALSVNE